MSHPLETEHFLAQADSCIFLDCRSDEPPMHAAGVRLCKTCILTRFPFIVDDGEQEQLDADTLKERIFETVERSVFDPSLHRSVYAAVLGAIFSGVLPISASHAFQREFKVGDTNAYHRFITAPPH